MANCTIELLCGPLLLQAVHDRFLEIRRGGLPRSVEDMLRLMSEDFTKSRKLPPTRRWSSLKLSSPQKPSSPRNLSSPLKPPSPQKPSTPHKPSPPQKRASPEKTTSARRQKNYEVRANHLNHLQNSPSPSPSPSKSKYSRAGILPWSSKDASVENLSSQIDPSLFRDSSMSSSTLSLPKDNAVSATRNDTDPTLLYSYEFTIDIFVRAFLGIHQMLRELMDIDFDKQVIADRSTPGGFIIQSLDLEEAARLIATYDGCESGQMRLQVGYYREVNSIVDNYGIFETGGSQQGVKEALVETQNQVFDRSVDETVGDTDCALPDENSSGFRNILTSTAPDPFDGNRYGSGDFFSDIVPGPLDDTPFHSDDVFGGASSPLQDSTYGEEQDNHPYIKSFAMSSNPDFDP
ncbi:MAG: hypothetical protein MMC33_009103 [Icmadophila ericetorum]|nr:hypothetical protein [Icmadophila ericetorum]